ncbi:hypothetical protein IL306_013815 [Fusarium sp. DS 682]|nr:hypothetical protein IL306_013815 [Fusarium sp. DS 682]
MSTVQTVGTESIGVNGVRYAYRRLGPSSGVPILFLHHFRATIDHWDPALIQPFARKYPVILFDNAGVGHSSGEIPTSIAQMAKHVMVFLDAIHVSQVVLYGFSLGGMVAQQVALDDDRSLVQRLILSGTGPGRGTAADQLEMSEGAAQVLQTASGAPSAEGFMQLFFFPSDTSLAAGKAWWARV